MRIVTTNKHVKGLLVVALLSAATIVLAMTLLGR